MNITTTSLRPYSMSRLTEYERCPRRFYFKYIEKIPEIGSRSDIESPQRTRLAGNTQRSAV